MARQFDTAFTAMLQATDFKLDNEGSMGGQTMARREVVRMLGIAAAAAGFPGFHRWAFAGDGASSAIDPARDGGSAYRPQFFNASQFALIDHLSEMIIPADDSPGAHAAGVAEFIDFMVAHGVSIGGSAAHDAPPDSAALIGSDLQRQWLEGLAWIDAHCLGAYAHTFVGCSDAQQLELLTQLSYSAHYTSATAAGRDYFKLVRDYTVAGFYTSRAGLEALGYAGLQSFWDQVPECPHHRTDPEHRHLAASQRAADDIPAHA